jgi:anthranilate phosphoribosyltransferase
MIIKSVLNRLTDYQTLSKDEAKSVLLSIGKGEENAAQIAAFITVYMMRSITVEELEGFREALLELCLAVDFSGRNTVDVCGTGGDGKDTFNISTLSAFVLAAAGQPVAKHGNYGVSSVCGSSTVLEALGVHFTNNNDVLQKSMDECNLAFLHAPLFHPAMKNVGPIRKDLGVKTFFNMLGPLVNPASPPNQLVGVFSLELARLYQYLFQQNQTNFTILYGLEGYDEISLTGPVKVANRQGEHIYAPIDLGFEKVTLEQIGSGGSVASSVKIFKDVIEGKGTKAQQAVVTANAAMALACANPQINYHDAVALCTEVLQSGKVAALFKKYVSLNSN